MARPRSPSRDNLVASAMTVFWKRGYASTSVEDLVSATGVSRGGIYADYRDKEELFIGCLAAYRKRYADPAIAILQSHDNGIEGIDAYFSHFINLHRQHGLPGPGCFMANTMTERAPRDEAIRSIVADHMADLHLAFRRALDRASTRAGANLPEAELDDLAGFLATSSQGLWSYGRNIFDVRELERFKGVLLTLLKTRLETAPEHQGVGVSQEQDQAV